ncbi:Putative F0F1-ATPase subunit Ca2+/Mg2+ transporter [Gracilibacillus orientalis]|uniref:Putative F0F1-ATPase subunit Ca2+/Mg2+ transporter n=1 Tax=Gracilibacillus orientalis TaxID=334253 RepID=A0A1I4NLX3_9BACI|nr:AtpZ/AtpI family protein [Gracilibacillus orientalis]SFM16451.1 Putative F0F1-ATPase subunit Ca2+/Mg2+ transporter [Gracilibacillus orientalis]
MSPPKKSPYRGLAIYSAILSQIVGAPLIGLLIGKVMDKYLSTSPLLLVIGLLLGLGAGLYGTIHYVRDLTGDE